MKSSNPALDQRVFSRANAAPYGTEAMTINGTITKTFLLLLCTLATAAWTWSQVFTEHNFAAVSPFMLAGTVGGLVLAMVTIFKKEWSPVTAPLYSLAEGFVLGGASALAELRFPGVAMTSVGLTFGACFVMLFAYRTGIIQPTRRFMLGVVTATGAIVLVSLASWALSFFGMHIPGIYSSGPVGMLFSLAVVAIAALNLILDFSLVEQGAANRAPKYMEWYAGFALMVTLVWLYLAMLRLMSRRD